MVLDLHQCIYHDKIAIYGQDIGIAVKHFGVLGTVFMDNNKGAPQLAALYPLDSIEMLRILFRLYDWRRKSKDRILDLHQCIYNNQIAIHGDDIGIMIDKSGNKNVVIITLNDDNKTQVAALLFPINEEVFKILCTIRFHYYEHKVVDLNYFVYNGPRLPFVKYKCRDYMNCKDWCTSCNHYVIYGDDLWAMIDHTGNHDIVIMTLKDDNQTKVAAILISIEKYSTLQDLYEFRSGNFKPKVVVNLLKPTVVYDPFKW
jgi:hypothetical protein